MTDVENSRSPRGGGGNLELSPVVAAAVVCPLVKHAVAAAAAVAPILHCSPAVPVSYSGQMTTVKGREMNR